jgi:alkyl sulfatase BDS1-like metallo-beta-lactamase superfamily hydrolase
MARDLLALSTALLEGSASIDDHSPLQLGQGAELVELVEGLAFVESFANVTAVAANGELALVDTGGVVHAGTVHDTLRTWNADPLQWAVYTHGHVDHCFGVPFFEAEPGAPSVRVVAHEAVAERFDRYRLTAGYNGVINMRQFRLAAPLFPERFRYPDQTYRDRLELDVGGTVVELCHDRGETDDHSWAWLPGHKTLCTGDLFIWVSPNCGNPQKAQRYPREWAAALRRMQLLGAEVLLPGHGLPIVGAEWVDSVLDDTATLLESLLEQCLELMNDGARLDTLVHEVRAPEHLLERPWLHPLYDEPEFVVHNVWRLYGGWYDGNPANLKPAPEQALAAELATLAGGVAVLAERAGELAAVGELRLAGHLAELAVLADPADLRAQGMRADVNRERVAAERSLMAKGIFAFAQHQSELAAEQAAGQETGQEQST